MSRVTKSARELFYSSNKLIKFLSRLAAVSVISISAYSVLPVLADELSSDPTPPAVTDTSTVQTQPDPTPSVTESTEPAPAKTDAPAVSNSTASPVPSAPPKPEILKVQKGFPFMIPNSVSVDPRATSANLPNTGVSGAVETGLLCINAPGSIDIGMNHLSNDMESKDLIIDGDLTSSVRISGSTYLISSIINSGNGIRVVSANGKIVNKLMSFSYIGLTLPSVDPTFCAASPYRRNLIFRPLELQLDMTKAQVKLKK